MNFFIGKRKKILIFGILLLASVIVCALGLKFLPINKVLRLHTTSGSDFPDISQTSGKAPHSLYFDFEVAPGKTPPDGLYKGIAHSGVYSSRAFGKNSYATAFERKADEIGFENLKSVGWSAWVYVFPNDREVVASLVFAVSNELGVNVSWKGIGLSGPGIPRGKWFKISTSADLSEVKFKPGYKVQVYFWNNSSTDILVDDYFLVFNGSIEKRGDSAIFDMTKGVPFKEELNRPPFRTFLLKKEEIGNQDAPFLVTDQQKTGKLDPDATIVPGNFLGAVNGLDDIMVLDKKGHIDIFTFCPDRKKFVKTSVETSSEPSPFLAVKGIRSGHFLREANDQFLIISDREWVLGKFEKLKEPCDLDGAPQTKYTILWRSSAPEFSRTGTNAGSVPVTGDLDGDQLTEVLITTGDGSWRVYKATATPAVSFRQVASGNQAANWDYKNGEFRLSCGRFFSRLKQDVILTLFVSPETGKPVYTLNRFSPGKAAFETLYPGRDNNLGKTIGLDTLHIRDRFLTGNSVGSRPWILRYDRSWRFDLKQIQFNDTAFTILRNIDFTGYSGDHNPKYYEVLNLLPGHFLNPAVTSILVVGRNQKENTGRDPKSRDFQNKTSLPDFISVYALDLSNIK